ncbi:MAG: ADOP family duplicated permease [Candidatus Acidiferrales bacterium]
MAQVVVHVRDSRGEGVRSGQNGAAFELVRDNASVIKVAAQAGFAGGVNLVANRHVEYVRQQRVSAGYFSVLGVAPLYGREFTADEDRPGGAAVVVLSHALWRRIFQSDPSVLNQAVTLRGEPHTVVGIMPADFSSPAAADVWAPLRPSRTGEGGGTNYAVIARLNDGISWAQAQASLEPLGRDAAAAHEMSPDVTARVGLLPLQEMLTSGVREILVVLWGAVAVVLLVGCINIAGLLLARASRRRREVATRMALGGSRWVLMRQLLTESLVLAVMGGGLGLFVALASIDALNPHLGAGLGISETVRMDWRVLGAGIGLTFATSILLGLFPAWHASRTDIRAALVESGGHGVVGARGHWPRRLLLVFEVALGVLLVIGATQFTAIFLRLARLNPGFDGDGVFTASLSLQDARYKEAARVNALYNETLARIRTLPGVTHAAVALSLPYQRALNMGFRVLDGPNASADQWNTTNLVYVTPDYFDALRIPLLRGRLLCKGDGGTAPLVAVVNAAFAKKYLPNQEAVGTHLLTGGRSFEVVGVAGDMLQRAGWGNYGPMGAIPGVFIPAAQITDGFVQLVHTWFQPNWIVRVAGSHEGLIAGMQRALAAADPLLPFSAFGTMGEIRGAALARHRFEALLVNGFAALALLLSAIGIGGLIASSVAERWREMGVRVALGASLGQAIRTVAAPGIVLTLAGVALGSLAAYPALLAIQKLMWGIRPSEPANFIVAALVLVLVATVASFAPAIRLRRLNVADTLREG